MASVLNSSASPDADSSTKLRERITVAATAVPRRVRMAEMPSIPRRKLFSQQTQRILKLQRRWERIKEDLPPQLSRKHIGMISIGGVIGTGLFLGSADALRNGGPVGAFLGYFVIGTVVYCLCVSVGEMIAFLPNVGGVVGLADLYVDPALGFSLGWAAWYNWSVTLPAEISAAVVAIQFWTNDQMAQRVVAAISAAYLTAAIAINCFPSRVYGEMEFYMSCLKVTTIVIIIVCCLLIDVGASWQGYLGFRYWKEQPFPKTGYLGIDGAKGRFLGFWAVLMQASFSFFGSDCAGIASGEVIDATRNVPRALQKVWIRISLFYLGGVFASGLVVSANDTYLWEDTADKTGRSSPFVIAFWRASWRLMPDVVNAAIVVSAWSAAASDIYISSRFLFFLARRGHAPTFLAHLFRYPRTRRVHSHASDSDSEQSEDTDSGSEAEDDEHGHSEGLGSDELLGGQTVRAKHTYVMPLASVLVSSSVGLLTFLSYGTGHGANEVFSWLVSVASVASLQSWAAVLFTYTRWYHGTVRYEEKSKGDDSEEAREARAQIELIKKHRKWGQPYLAYYALVLCLIVLLTNGWAVFVHNDWRIAEIQGEDPKSYLPTERESNPTSLFLSSYVPLPFFILLTFGYKLIKQTRMIPLDEMTFTQGKLPPRGPVTEETKPEGGLERFLTWIMII